MNKLAFLRGYLGKLSGEVRVDSKQSVARGQVVETRPSEAQKKSGNYKCAHVELDGMDITIENPKGSVREGVDAGGRKWRCAIKADYGYIKGTEGYDKDHLDLTIKPGYVGGAGVVHVINQKNARGGFDEHKCVLGAVDESDALRVYRSNYEKGWDGVKSCVAVPLEAFKAWAYNGGPAKGELVSK